MTKTRTCTISPDAEGGLRYDVRTLDGACESGAIDHLGDLASLADSLDGADVVARSESGRACDIGELLLEYWADQPGALHLDFNRERRLVVSLLDAAWSGEPYEELAPGAYSATYEWLDRARRRSPPRAHGGHAPEKSQG